jgi:hypothetical protein
MSYRNLASLPRTLTDAELLLAEFHATATVLSPNIRWR